MKQRRVGGSKRRRAGRAFLLVAAGAVLALSQIVPVAEAQNVTEPTSAPSETNPTTATQAEGANPSATTSTAATTSGSAIQNTDPTTAATVAATTATASGATSAPLSLEDTCGGLNCQHDSTCEAGNATYSLDSDVGFHTITNQNGFHCNCPDGYGGLDCSRPYQKCTLSDMSAECYHGGTCLPESSVVDVQYAAFCECSQAVFNGQRYAGKYCEVAVEDGDYCPEQSGLFCLNGGSCPNGGARAPHVCTCLDGYFGVHCEFKTTQGPECTLKCFSEGVCKVGRVNAPWGNHDDFYCDCPRGYGGVQCEHLSEQCGDGQTLCLHGATCESAISAEGKTEFSCKCPEPFLGGSSCQERRGMELCNPTLGPEYSLSMAAPAFCLNGGTCRDVKNGELVYVSTLCWL